MCHLNLLIMSEQPKRNKDLNKVISFIQKVTKESYKTNDDGDGLMILNKVFKSKRKLNLNHFRNYIKQSNLILTHQRISTSGKSAQYTQPFKINEFIIAHNGILSDYDYNNHSDTYNFFMVFLKNLALEKENNKHLFKPLSREKLIIKVLKHLLDNNPIGSYSITLYDTKADALYYFKNSTTNIYFYKNHKYLYITTSFKNDKYLNMLNKNFIPFEIKDFSIYRIRNDLSVKEIATIEQPHVEINHIWNDYKTQTDYAVIEDYKRSFEDERTNPFNRCGYGLRDKSLSNYA